MFCQKNSLKDRLVELLSLKMSTQILDMAKFDSNLQVQLAAVNDLIADECKYQYSCLMRLQNDLLKNERWHTRQRHRNVLAF